MSDPKIVVYQCPRLEAPPLYLPLSRHDINALQVQAPITLGYRLQTYLEPSILCQSLSVLLEHFPAFAGCLVTLNNVLYVRTRVHDAEVQALEVTADLLDTPMYWVDVMLQLPLRRGQTAGGRFYQVILLRTADPLDGCTLLVSIDHALADAFTCGLLMAEWSAIHKSMTGLSSSETGTLDTPPIETDDLIDSPIDIATLPGDFEIACDAPVIIRRFHFHPKQFASLRATINSKAPVAVSINDILIAICVCATARYEERVGPNPTVSTMADARGRGVPSTLMGNGARALQLPLSWDVALSRDLAAVANAIRAAMTTALEELQVRCEADDPLANLPTTIIERAGDAAPTADNKPEMQATGNDAELNDEKTTDGVPDSLFYFNSWARIQQLVGADFGAGLTQFEWVTLRTVQRRRSFIVVPVNSAGVLALQACLPDAEMEYFCFLWDTFRASLSN